MPLVDQNISRIIDKHNQWHVQERKATPGCSGLSKKCTWNSFSDCRLPRRVGGRGVYLKAAAKVWKGSTLAHIAHNAQEEWESLIPRRTCTMHTPVCMVCPPESPDTIYKLWTGIFTHKDEQKDNHQTFKEAISRIKTTKSPNKELTAEN